MDGILATIVVDASLLINFLRIDQTELFARCPSTEFVMTEHVRGEVRDFYADQVEALERALAANHVRQEPVQHLAALELFAELSVSGQLGNGECAAISVAVVNGWIVGMDDKTAIKIAKAKFPALQILTTEDLMVRLIKGGHLRVDDADQLKDLWASQHRFRLAFDSFSDKL